ncbi:CdaR family transcriptional regulator [Bacillus sp. FJAT-42315]|uniref:CdaR family transcriptional regulator n=1 Tax=Bacillus sp. FJAT-42315 TaxID=2014077 RepID=UPI000C244807|nr:sugar diacid recognition domain-containing protein [Bacillus sp. FJAT-42315]
MKFLEQIAQSIVERTSSVLEVPMSITDKKGTIIGCNDIKRIGSHHVVTKEVIQAGKSIVFTPEKVIHRKNVLPGIATPICFQQQIIGVLGIIGDPEKIEKYVQFVRNHVEMLLQEAFRAESFFLEMKTTEVFVQHLIHYKEWDQQREEVLVNYSEMLGFHFDLSRLCILIDIPFFEAQKNKQTVTFSQYDLFQMVSHLFKDHAEDIICPINQDQWMIIKFMSTFDSYKIKERCERAVKKLKHFNNNNNIAGKVSISYGNIYKGFAGVSQSYQQALNALVMGKEKKAEESVYAFDDWKILLDTLVKEINPLFSDTLHEYIKKLLAHSNAQVLIKTFLLYCEQDLNVSKAARKLYIHRNTLMYRLNQLSEILCINVQSFEQCMLLYLALKQCAHVKKTAGRVTAMGSIL